MYADNTRDFPNYTFDGHVHVEPIDYPDEPVDPEFVSMIDELEGTDNESLDLYAVLGVARSATSEDLRAAYKRLSLLLHPDKHSVTSGDVNASLCSKSDAEAAFGRISAAYAILKDPKKREIYDNFGFKALQMQGWQLATCTKSAPELRLEYLLLKQKAMEAKQMQLTQPSSEFSLGLDLTDTFDRYLKEAPNERSIFPFPTIYELALAQSVTAGISLKHSVSLAGQVTAHNGIGVGTCFLIWRYHCSKKSFLVPTTVDTELSYGRGGRGLSLGLRVRRDFGERCVGQLGLVFGSWYNRASKSSLFILPGISAALNMQLLPQLHGRLELRALTDPGISTELLWSSNDDYLLRFGGKISASGNMGVSVRFEKSVSWSCLSPLYGSGIAEEDAFRCDSTPEWAQSDNLESEVHSSKKGVVFGSVDFNTSDLVEFSMGAHCCVSVYSRVSGQISLSLQRGVKLKLSLLRGTQTYSFPFILSEYFDKAALGYGVFVPLLAFAVFRTLIYEPYLSRQMANAQKVRRAKLRDTLSQRRREALSTQSLMKSAAVRSKHVESKKLGLIIDRAVFGCISLNSNTATPSDDAGPLCLDVTIPLQAMVELSQLRLPPGHWADLQGFYDPCVGIYGVRRSLRVLYTFHNVPHEITVHESEGLAIPMSKHRIEEFRTQ